MSHVRDFEGNAFKKYYFRKTRGRAWFKSAFKEKSGISSCAQFSSFLVSDNKETLSHRLQCYTQFINPLVERNLTWNSLDKE